MASKTIIHTTESPAPGGNYSQAVRIGNMVYVAGTCPFELGTGKILYPGDMEKQTELVLQYIDRILHAAGTSKEHVVKVTSFINDLDKFKQYDAVYAKYFTEKPPARSTIEVSRFPEGMCVEIECIAYIP